MISQYQENKLDLSRPWFSKGGCPPYLTPEELKKHFVGEDKISHKSIDTAQIQKVVKNAMKKQLTEQGKCPLDSLLENPCQRTARNYKALIAGMEEVSVKKSSVDKTVVREMAENSLRATASYFALWHQHIFYLPT